MKILNPLKARYKLDENKTGGGHFVLFEADHEIRDDYNYYNIISELNM